MHDHHAAFVLNRIQVPVASEYPGEKYLHGFVATLSAVESWIGENV